MHLFLKNKGRILKRVDNAKYDNGSHYRHLNTILPLDDDIDW